MACAAILWAAFAVAAQAQIVVTNTNDSGTGSLRAAILLADASPGSTITFSLPANATITLATDLPAITVNTAINGGGVSGLTLNGNNANRGFFVYAGTVNVSNIAIVNTLAAGGSSGSGGGGAGLGGGLFVASGANVLVSNVSIQSSAAVGGNVGAGTGSISNGGGGLGGNGANTNGSASGGGVGNQAIGTYLFGPAPGTGIIVGAASGGGDTGTLAHAGGAWGGGGGNAALNVIGAGGAGGGVGGSPPPTTGNGGDGGFGGGGGGAYNNGGNGGAGGFGGGGGGARAGGGPFAGGAGGFGGGGGGDGAGGNGGTGGFGGGSGSTNLGGGGAGMGGAIFVQQGGGLTIAGPLTINGNSVTGGTSTVSNVNQTAGGNGSAFGSGIFLQGNGGTLNFQPGTGITQTVSNVIADQTGSGGTGGNAGAWALAVSGGGALVLSGTNTYSGGTTVTGATLTVNGAIGDPVIGSGGVLNGTGSVGNTQINSGGTFAPGNGTPGTSMTINGGLTFTPNATYQVYLNQTTSSFAAVTGSASLNGTVLANFAAGSYLARQYTVLTTTGGAVTGTFANLSTVNLPAGFTSALSYSTNSVNLNLTAVLGQSGTLPTGNLNQNQQNVANSLNGYFNTGGSLPPAFTNIFGLTGDSLARALTQVDGEVAADASLGAFQMMDQFLGLMLDPFVDDRSGLRGDTMGFAQEQAPLPSDIALAYASALKSPPAPGSGQPWSVWGKAFGASNTTSGNAVLGSSSVASRTYGVVSGADYRVTPDSVVGFSLGGGGLNWGLDSTPGSGRSDVFQVGVYGTTRSGPAYLSAALAFANLWMSTNRTALGSQLTASFSGQSYGTRLESGYRFALASRAGSPWGVTPYAALQAQAFRTAAFSETDQSGGGLGLNFAANNATNLRSELGGRFDAPLAFQTMPLILRAKLAWAHDTASGQSLNASFQALPGTSFTVNGTPMPKDAVLASAGAELRVAPAWTLMAKFDGAFSSVSRTYGATATVRYAW